MIDAGEYPMRQAKHNRLFTYDKVGNRLTSNEDSSLSSYTHNNLNQLIQTSAGAPKLIRIAGTVTEATPVTVRINGFKASVVGNQFTLDNYGLVHGSNTLTAKATDSSGNASTHQISVTYNSNNPATSYTYDANGNLTQKISGLITETFTYDYENRLKTYSAPGQSASYTYNGEGQRIAKTVNGITTSYYYDGPELILERTGANSIYYVHSNRIDEVVCDSRGYSYHSDGLGSITNLTDSAGLNANTYNYKAFGSIRSQSGTVANAWRYTGRQYDAESGLHFYRNRYYDARVGRFITQDPSLTLNGNSRLVPYLLMNNLSSPSELQKYLYCVNNPVNLIDPWGLEPGSWINSLNQKLGIDTKNNYFDGSLFWANYFGSVEGAFQEELVFGIAMIGASNPAVAIGAGICLFAANSNFAIDAYKKAWLPIYVEEQYPGPIIRRLKN